VILSAWVVFLMICFMSYVAGCARLGRGDFGAVCKVADVQVPCKEEKLEGLYPDGFEDLVRVVSMLRAAGRR